ncbi:PAS domain-containing protein, partial [Candidatus Bathyarchaeota archaeon]|nr:PAS domain-containing protein [Candidatus Bathyarchaeota archaeon]
MTDFTGNHLPDEVRRRLGRHAAPQLQPLVPAPASMPKTEMLTPSDSAGTGSEGQPDMYRRQNQNYQATFATPQNTPHPAARQLSMRGFGASEDTGTPYQFAQSSMPTDSINSAISHPGTTLDYPGILPMPGLPNDMMNSMVSASFTTMGVSHGDLGMLESPTFDDSFVQATMGSGNHGFDMGLGAEDGSMHGHASHRGTVDVSGEDMDMLSFSSNVSPIDGITSTSSHSFSQTLQGTDQNNGNGDNLRATTHNLATAMRPSQTLSFRLPSDKAALGPITQTNTAAPRALVGPQPLPQMRGKSMYSKSGFDMMRALHKVANRKDPDINIGAVDMSCAFVVCDATMNDCPIIYASDSFQNLTGYNRHEIFGRNCRFLQAPDGNVEAGIKREFVDDAAVFQLKQNLNTGSEVQQSLINYRKGGKPFLNLLTVIPISWDTDDIRYFVGFQVDLVECPEALYSNKEAGGVKVDYKNNDLSQQMWEPPPVPRQEEPENGQTLGLDDISTLLQQFFAKGAVASDWHKQSWHKMLLENAGDLIHVIS